jgi:hypothetical protein
MMSGSNVLLIGAEAFCPGGAVEAGLHGRGVAGIGKRSAGEYLLSFLIGIFLDEGM